MNNFLSFLEHLIESILFIINLQVDPSGEIIMFHSSGCPWKEHLFDIEVEKQLKPQIKFIIYQDQHHHYRIQVGFQTTNIRREKKLKSNYHFDLIRLLVL